MSYTDVQKVIGASDLPGKIQTYGQEALESRNYNKYLSRTLELGKKQIMKRSLGISGLFFVMFGFYAYSFFWGGYLRYNGIKNGESEYTGGACIGIMFCVVFGAFNMGNAGPHMASIAEGRIGGKLAFEVIDHNNYINPDDQSAKKLNKSDVKGHF